MNLLEFARRLPKAELHVHLEGSIQPQTLLKLAQRNGSVLPVQNEVDLQSFYQFRDFGHFIRVYSTVTRCLRTADDYRLIAYEFGRECARQNICYAEATFSVYSNMYYTGLPWQEIVAGLNAGRQQARAEWGVEWGWIFDIVRDVPETQQAVLDIALAAREEGVVALGLGGSEAKFPPELFCAAFDQAYAAGLASIPHAGEFGGPASVWGAIDRLHAVRIGHGVRSIEDPALVDALRERGIPLEVCPTSNIRLGVYADYASHPLRRLWEAGVPVTVNSDDPPMFGADLNHEYEALVRYFGFGADELEQISLNALRFSRLPETRKAELTQRFRQEFAILRAAVNPV